ncbi:MULTISPECIES: hypothetical protein [unclassified Fusibacter]|uniref:DUF7695 domain-containing protein n=1 Tax=unclassified Fusibacter TaxID=2624464 RepID=UPI001013597A|nr:MULTISPECIES: hypothetical protein [unclassified Fusibacter]MCK8059081.1 hypothetical protein [Fusibacter sp. A2]NPE22490.1 hypothetical protein [Fusibacter sp. A1]RXV60594.1 hypothetical protein DWB64_11635 [Fusibacter sp. A1]
MKIIKNIAQCRECKAIIQSHNHRDNYTYCECKRIAVKGGNSSILRLGHHRDIIEMSHKEY